MRCSARSAENRDGRRAYVNCKFSNMWFVYELVRRIVSTHIAQGEKTLSVNGFDPGLRLAVVARSRGLLAVA